MFEVRQGDCVELMRAMPAGSVDAVVTDPPYGLEFMGKDWDRLGGSFSESAGSGEWAAQHNTIRKGFDGYGPLPNYVGGGNVKCPDCGRPVDGRDPSKPDRRAGYRCVCGGAKRARQREATRAMQEWHQAWATEALRVLKPGGHLLAFGGTRTYHRLVCAVEDAGFEIRDTICWLYGSGFPKSLDVSKAIDKRRDWTLVERLAEEIKRARAETGWSLAEMGKQMQCATDGQYGRWYHRGGHKFFETGRSLPSRPEWNHIKTVLPVGEEFQTTYDEAEREVVGSNPNVERAARIVEATGGGEVAFGAGSLNTDVTAPATPEAERWDGWGTALKPSHEPVVVARKPLSGTVAGNVLEHGCGALNVDGCRVGIDEAEREVIDSRSGFDDGVRDGIYHDGVGKRGEGERFTSHLAGRWPPNVILDGEAARLLDEQSGELKRGDLLPGHVQGQGQHTHEGGYVGGGVIQRAYGGDSGGASRFFPSFTQDTLCVLCSLPCAESAGTYFSPNDLASSIAPDDAQGPLSPAQEASEPSSDTTARPVAPSSMSTRLTSTETMPTAPPSADTQLADWIVRRVRSATNLCDSCATATAHEVAERLLNPTEESAVGWGSTSGRNVRILSRDLALVAAGSRSTGTIPTTATLSALCGSAVAATLSSIPTAGTENDPDRIRLRYCPKSSRQERNAGLEGFARQGVHRYGAGIGEGLDPSAPSMDRNTHPTVKPISLMRWLVRLVIPPNGTVLDPFAGSGTTGCAAVLEGFDFIGLEREPEYVDIAKARVAWWHKHRGTGEAAEILAAGEARDSVEATGQLGLEL